VLARMEPQKACVMQVHAIRRVNTTTERVMGTFESSVETIFTVEKAASKLEDQLETASHTWRTDHAGNHRPLDAGG
jgi:hypothetical protein